MTALIGVVAAAAALTTPLPPLPAQGLVLDAPTGIYARVARDRRMLLAQWSGECESPTAFLITRDRRLRPAGVATRRAAPESRALGWSPSGHPVVDFPGGVCAGACHGGPGVYSLDADGTPRQIYRTRPRQQVAFWG